METTTIAWPPCFCDPWLGVAHFDGITIRADPITSARPDRILPTILDEQIALCRYIASRERDCKGRKAIDLGSGSGVLSIYAAMLGMSVKGVDIVDRAIDYADYNVLQQAPSFLAAKGGAVTFSKADVCTLTETGEYDVVIMNPPFSPTIGADAPKCTNGGTNGQDVFQQFFAKAAQLLRPGGRCYAVHLMETDKQGNPTLECLRHTDASEWSAIRIATIRTMRILAEEFIRREYSWISTPEPNSELSKAISDSRERQTYFDLVIVEGQRATTNRSQVTPKLEKLAYTPPPFPDDWSDRILLHTQVMLNSLSPCEDASRSGEMKLGPNKSRIPSGAVLLDISSVGHSVHGQPSEPLQRLDEWLAQNHFLGNESDYQFQTLMVEAVPWSHRAFKHLSSVTTLWSVGAARDKLKLELDTIFEHIKRFNASGRSIFLHPGLDAPRHSHWQTAATRTMAAPKELAALRSDRLNRNIQDFQTSCQSSTAVTYDHSLEKLDVIPTTTAVAEKFEDDLENALRQFSSIISDPQHRSIGRCHFYYLPMPMPQPASRTEGKIGALYVYAWTRYSWSPVQEDRLLDVARIASTFYAQQYSAESAGRMRRLQLQSILDTAQHELGKVVDVIRPSITESCSNAVRQLFRMSLEVDMTSNDCPEYWSKCYRNLPDLLKEMAIEAYAIHRLVTDKRPQYASITEDDIVALRAQAERIIVVNNDTPTIWRVQSECWGRVSEQIKQSHFRAAICAAIRNVLKHSLTKTALTALDDGSTPDHLPCVFITPDTIVAAGREIPAVGIRNTYVSKYSPDIDRANYDLKNTHDLLGTARVLSHYALLLVEGTLLSSIPPSEYLNHLSSQEITENPVTWRHTWRSVVPMPTQEKKL